MKIQERIILFIISVGLLIGVSADTFLNAMIPVWLISKVESYYNFSVVIYQIQATIITLGIALITILSSMSSESIYGVPTPRFILHLRPKVLKHRNIITVLIGSILLSYIFISFNMYNTVVAMLFISSILILLMTYEIFSVFDGREQLKMEIGNYIKNGANDLNLLNAVFKDVRIALDRNEILKYKEDMDLIIHIFEEITERIEADSTIKENWENGFATIFNDAFSKTRGQELKATYSYFESVYQVISEKFKFPNKFVLWDNVSREFFYGLKMFELEDIHDLSLFSSIRWKVYLCLHYSKVEEEINRNNYYLEDIYLQIYYSILSNKSKTRNYGKAELIRKLKDNYDDIMCDITFGRKTDAIPVLLNELRIYTRMLIDNQEAKVLDLTFTREIYAYSWNGMEMDLKVYYITMIIYIYYLSEFEVLLDDKEKEFTTKFLQNLKQGVSEFLMWIAFERQFEGVMIDAIRNNLDRWERMPEYDAKSLVMDKCIDSFFVFSVIHADKNVIALKDILEKIVGVNILSFINKYTGSKKLIVSDQYKKFVNIFYDTEIEDNVVLDDLKRLESVLYDIYKSYHIAEGNDKAIDEKELNQLMSKYQIKMNDSVSKDLDLIDLNNVELVYDKGYFEVIISTYSSMIEFSLDNTVENVTTYLLYKFLMFLIEKNQIKYIEVSYRDKSALSRFFDLKNSHRLDFDTLLGYRDKYNGYEMEKEFKQFESQMKKVKATKISDMFMCVDSNRLSINSIRCDVEIVDLNFEELLVTLKRDDEGDYFYSINEIWVTFNENELKEYIRNTRKNIKVKFDFNYYFADDLSGVAVLFVPKKDAEQNEIKM